MKKAGNQFIHLNFEEAWKLLQEVRLSVTLLQITGVPCTRKHFCAENSDRWHSQKPYLHSTISWRETAKPYTFRLVHLENVLWNRCKRRVTQSNTYDKNKSGKPLAPIYAMLFQISSFPYICNFPSRSIEQRKKRSNYKTHLYDKKKECSSTECSPRLTASQVRWNTRNSNNTLPGTENAERFSDEGVGKL